MILFSQETPDFPKELPTRLFGKELGPRTGGSLTETRSPSMHLPGRFWPNSIQFASISRENHPSRSGSIGSGVCRERHHPFPVPNLVWGRGPPPRDQNPYAPGPSWGTSTIRPSFREKNPPSQKVLSFAATGPVRSDKAHRKSPCPKAGAIPL